MLSKHGKYTEFRCQRINYKSRRGNFLALWFIRQFRQVKPTNPEALSIQQTLSTVFTNKSKKLLLN